MEPIEGLDEQVRGYLAELGLEPARTHDGLYLFKYGSTAVIISLFEAGEDTFIRFASVLLKDFEPSLEFLQRLLRLNTEVLFGSFLLFEDNTLSFSATLLGKHVTFPAFEATLVYVARVSDDFDDELQSLGGGQRARDLLEAP